MKRVELPVINNQEGNFLSGSCFRYYAFREQVDGHGIVQESESKAASYYFVKGLQALHQGHWLASILELSLQEQQFQRAFAYFHQALAAKPDYFCARQALRATAFRLGHEDVAEAEEYALQRSDNPHPERPCHLLHPGFYSASDLSRLEESLKEKK